MEEEEEELFGYTRDGIQNEEMALKKIQAEYMENHLLERSTELLNSLRKKVEDLLL